VFDVEKKFMHYTGLIRRDMAEEIYTDYFKGYAEYHYDTYIRETIIGESTVSDTSLESIERLKKEEIESKPARKVKNLYKAVEILFPDVFNTNQTVADDFTPDLLRGIHSLIGDGLFIHAGEYRIHGAKPAQELWTYLDASEISHSLECLCSYVRKQMVLPVMDDIKLQCRVKIAATFITNFLQIHPFSNGNGRVARLAGSLILIGSSIVPVPVYAIKDSREVFLECIRRSRELNNTMYFPKDLARLILESATQTSRQVCCALDLN